MKSSRKDLDKQTAIPEPYDSFFSFPKSKGGYSGVAVYCDPSCAVAHKAEEGLSGSLQPKPPLNVEERVSSSYPHASELPLLEDENGAPPTDLDALDSEGRALVLDFGLFVLINVYCPNDASDSRMVFKMNWHFMLQERVRILIAEGREVIVLGDINVVAALIDHGEGTLESKRQGFFEPPHRAWFQRWLAPRGPMHDVIRSYWPDREGMYTCESPSSCSEVVCSYFSLACARLEYEGFRLEVKGRGICIRPSYSLQHDSTSAQNRKDEDTELLYFDSSCVGFNVDDIAHYNLLFHDRFVDARV